jgi:hypothetical protein
MKQTAATSWETHHLIASDRVEGTHVRNTDGSTIATIERVMIDKITGYVAYAVLSFNGPVGVGQRLVYQSLGLCSPTIENSRPISSTSPKRNSARCPMGGTSPWATAAVKSSATMMTERKSIGELPKVGEPRRDQAAAWI